MPGSVSKHKTLAALYVIKRMVDDLKTEEHSYRRSCQVQIIAHINMWIDDLKKHG